MDGPSAKRGPGGQPQDELDPGSNLTAGAAKSAAILRPGTCDARAAGGPPAPGLRRILYAIGCRILRGNDASGFVGSRGLWPV